MLTSMEDCQGRILPFPPEKRFSALVFSPKAALRKLAPKDSVLACAVLTGYVALYIGVGFAGLELLSWAWTKLFS